MYQKTSSGDRNITTPTTQWTQECFDTNAPAANHNQKNNRRKLWFGLLILVLIAILGVIVWRYSKPGSKSPRK